MSGDFDFQELARRTRAAREFVHEEPGGVRLTVRYPSRYEWAAFDARHGEDRPAHVRAVVLASVVGWEGVQVLHAYPATKVRGMPLPYGEDEKALLFEERVDWMASVWGAVRARVEARDREHEESLKNWQAASGTNASEPSAATS